MHCVCRLMTPAIISRRCESSFVNGKYGQTCAEESRNHMASISPAVSYTHLDVYKRQVSLHGARFIQAWQIVGIVGKIGIHFEYIFIRTFQGPFKPVSYTHLADIQQITMDVISRGRLNFEYFLPQQGWNGYKPT